MSYKSVRRAIRKRLLDKHYYSRVAVEFPEEHRIVYMTEAEIRALQVEAAEVYRQGGKEAFDAFTSQFIIYNGRTKRGSRPMVLRTDGIFYNEFKPGFYDVTTELAVELF